MIYCLPSLADVFFSCFILILGYNSSQDQNEEIFSLLSQFHMFINKVSLNLKVRNTEDCDSQPWFNEQTDYYIPLGLILKQSFLYNKQRTKCDHSLSYFLQSCVSNMFVKYISVLDLLEQFFPPQIQIFISDILLGGLEG